MPHHTLALLSDVNPPVPPAPLLTVFTADATPVIGSPTDVQVGWDPTSYTPTYIELRSTGQGPAVITGADLLAMGSPSTVTFSQNIPGTSGTAGTHDVTVYFSDGTVINDSRAYVTRRLQVAARSNIWRDAGGGINVATPAVARRFDGRSWQFLHTFFFDTVDEVDILARHDSPRAGGVDIPNVGVLSAAQLLADFPIGVNGFNTYQLITPADNVYMQTGATAGRINWLAIVGYKTSV